MRPRYIAHLLAANDEPSFAIEVDGEAVGGISLHPGTDVERIGAEIGYWLGESLWGRGVATSAIRLVTDYAFTRRRLERVFAVPFITNVASCRVARESGISAGGNDASERGQGRAHHGPIPLREDEKLTMKYALLCGPRACGMLRRDGEALARFGRERRAPS